MELLKNLFKNEDRVIGLCAFKKEEEKNFKFEPNFSVEKKIYSTNYNNNFFLL